MCAYVLSRIGDVCMANCACKAEKAAGEIDTRRENGAVVGSAAATVVAVAAFVANDVNGLTKLILY